MKQYVGLVRDHSASMAGIVDAARRDYNDNIDAIKEASVKEGIDTILNVIAFEDINNIKREVVNSSINGVKPLGHYSAPGHDTPLFDSVGELVEIMGKVPDVNDPGVSFLVMVTTDGVDNSSRRFDGRDIAQLIKKLQNTDRWTFTFRVPYNQKTSLVRLGIPAENIREWEQTERGFQEATLGTRTAISSFYGARAQGATSSRNFYANMGTVSARQVENSMSDISHQVRELRVNGRTRIDEFIELKTNRTYQKGTAFYQLSKSEKAVQSHKNFIVRNHHSGKLYAGQEARTLLGIPTGGTIALKPGDHGDWDIFIQSTSNNRILLPGTDVIYWAGAVGY